MYKHQTCRAIALALLLLGTFGHGSARGGLEYSLSADTSTISGLSGYLDFQLNPGSSGAEAATATITNFQSVGGTLAGTSTNTGDATGTLPGTLTLDNGTAFNDSFQAFTFGSRFSFDLTLSGPAVNSLGGTAGSTFSLSLYGADQITALLTTDTVNGTLLTLNLNADGTTSVLNYSSGTPPALVVTPLVAAVPEPPSLVLGLLGSFLAGVLGLTRWWRGRDHPIWLSQG